MSLKGLIQEKVAKVEPKTSIAEAAKLMFNQHVGDVVVVEKANWAQGTPRGILTDRDIAMVLGKKGEIDPQMQVQEIMTENVIMGSLNDGVYETIRKMKQNGIQRMPIIDQEDQLVGIISADDILQLLGDEIQQLSQVIESERTREGLKSTRPSLDSGQPIQPNI